MKGIPFKSDVNGFVNVAVGKVTNSSTGYPEFFGARLRIYYIRGSRGEGISEDNNCWGISTDARDALEPEPYSCIPDPTLVNPEPTLVSRTLLL